MSSDVTGCSVTESSTTAMLEVSAKINAHTHTQNCSQIRHDATVILFHWCQLTANSFKVVRQEMKTVWQHYMLGTRTLPVYWLHLMAMCWLVLGCHSLELLQQQQQRLQGYLSSRDMPFPGHCSSHYLAECNAVLRKVTSDVQWQVQVFPSPPAERSSLLYFPGQGTILFYKCTMISRWEPSTLHKIIQVICSVVNMLMVDLWVQQMMIAPNKLKLMVVHSKIKLHR